MRRVFGFLAFLGCFIFASSGVYAEPYQSPIRLGHILAAVAPPIDRSLILDTALIEHAEPAPLAPVYLLSYLTNGASLELGEPAL